MANSDIRILVVEDNGRRERSLHDLLASLYVQCVDVCTDSIEALAFVTANTPDIIVSHDAMYPMDSLEFVRTLRSDPNDKRRRIPVIFVTNDACAFTRIRLQALGAVAFVPANPDYASMAASIGKALNVFGGCDAK